jgi:hypothetical protein
MITKLKPKIDKAIWQKVYFLFPRTIEINNEYYRIYKDYVWRRTVSIYDNSRGWNNEWLYSLIEPIQKEITNEY